MKELKLLKHFLKILVETIDEYFPDCIHIFKNKKSLKKSLPLTALLNSKIMTALKNYERAYNLCWRKGISYEVLRKIDKESLYKEKELT